MSANLLPLKWEYQDIVARDAAMRDRSRLIEICNNWDQKVKVEGVAFADDYIENCILGKDELPPIDHADVKKYAFRVIENTDGQIVGFFNIYHGYPDDSCLWIGMFMIDQEFQNKSYGSKVISSLVEMAKTRGWIRCGPGVYLKNWSGLRFWVNNSFKEIGRVLGDKQYLDTAFSLISLYRSLDS